MAGKIQVYIASSLDGFIAGLDNDLSWLPGPPEDGSDNGYAAFMAGIGALLMGRATYDVVAGFEGPWPYGDTPVLVASNRPLNSSVPTVRHVQGDISSLLAQARAVAGDRDVYLDGGNLIRQAMEIGQVDRLVVTLIPVILGRGHPLFAGMEQRRRLKLLESQRLPGDLVQLTYVPAPAA
jgi:dihydrofolate reductase